MTKLEKLAAAVGTAYDNFCYAERAAANAADAYNAAQKETDQ